MVTQKIQNLCPVCGYEMEEPPKDYNICPSCGTEFGHHDVNSSISELRAAWIKGGLCWWSKTDPQPQNWNPYGQLAALASAFGTLSVSGAPVFVITAASTTMPGSRVEITDLAGWAGWAGWASVQPEHKEREGVSA